VAARRREIEASGTQLAFVTMAADDDARRMFERHDLADVPRVSDPDQSLYRAFGLGRAGLGQVVNPGVLGRGFAAARKGHLQGRMVGDPMRLGGAFLVRDGRVAAAYRNRDVADRADYCEFVKG
jgi:hypothetical protein